MSELLTATCEKCGTQREAKPELAGRVGICPVCQERVRIPLPSQQRVIEATATPRVIRPVGWTIDPELRNQLIGIVAVLLVVGLFGRDWLRPLQSGAVSNGASHSASPSGVPVAVVDGPAGSASTKTPVERLPLGTSPHNGASSAVAALDELLPPVQPIVRRRPMPFDCPTATGVRTALFDPDNVHAMTIHATGRGNFLRKWVIDTGAPVGLQPAQLPEGRDFSLRFSPNGNRLAVSVSPSDTGLLLLNAKTGVTLRTKDTNRVSPLSVPAWHGDGSLIYGTPVGTVQQWEILSDESSLSLSQGQPVTSVAVSDTGYLISGDVTGECRLWSLLENGRYAASYNKLKTPIRVLETRLAGDGALVFAAAGEPGKAWDCHIFDLATQQTLHSLALSGEVTSLAISSDWRRIVTGNRSGVVTTWEVLSGDEVETAAVHAGAVTTVAISADNSCVMTGCYDSRDNADVTVRLRPLPAPLVPAQTSVNTETRKPDDTDEQPLDEGSEL